MLRLKALLHRVNAAHDGRFIQNEQVPLSTSLCAREGTVRRVELPPPWESLRPPTQARRRMNLHFGIHF